MKAAKTKGIGWVMLVPESADARTRREQWKRRFEGVLRPDERERMIDEWASEELVARRGKA